MSHKPTPYSPNFPASQGYGLPVENDKPSESYPMNPQGGYPGPPPAHTAQPGPGYHLAQPMQPGFQPGFQPGLQPGFQPGFVPGYPHPQPQPGYPHPQPPIMHQPGPQGPPGNYNHL